MSYCSVGDIEQELKTTTPFSRETYPELDTVSDWIDRISSWIDEKAGISFGSNTITNELHSYHGERFITLRKEPVSAITTLEYNSANDGETPVWEAKTEGHDFYFNSDLGGIEIIFNKFSPKKGMNKFRVTYTQGYDAVPSKVKELTIAMVTLKVLRASLNDNINTGNLGGTTSVGNVRIVEPENLGLDTFKKLDNDVERLKKEVLGEQRAFRFNW